MPVLFWVDIIGLCISILVAGSLTLLVVVVDPNNQKNRSFGMFTGTMVIWTGAAILLRLSLWLEPVLPTSLFLPNPYPWLVISTVSIPLMCILSLMFTATFLDRRTRWTDLSIGAGLLLVIFFLIRSMVTKGAVIPDVYIDANGLVVHEIRTSALVSLGVFNLYILRSIVLFWQERHRTEANYLALGLLILLLGLIFRTFVYAPFPILSFSNALCAVMLAYGVISNQLFNPLRARTIELNKEMEERNEVERMLRVSEEKYRLLAENTADLISVLDMNLNFTYVSPASMRLRGYTAEEAIEQTLEQVLTPESIRIGFALFEEEMQLEASGMADPDRTRILELEEYKKDGSTIWVEVSFSFLRDKHQKPVGILMVSRDISERKRVEEEKRSMEERLQRAEKMESLGLLAGGVAHDLNNVLGIVIGYSELLLRDVEHSNSIRSKLDNIMEGGQKAAAIVQDLLTLARRGVSGRNVLNLNRIIADNQKSPEFANLFLHNSAVKLRTDLEPELLNISGSSVHLGKTIFNLVCNAIEAMPKGGVLTIRTDSQYQDKPVKGYDEIREGDYVILSVSDTGEGIHEADLKRIFEPFYTKKVMGRSGTGLGLAVVWGTVKDHNGYINVESEEGKGSTFTLYFPVTREKLAAETVSIDISEYMGKGESILIVDDIKGQRDLAEEMLKKLNYRVASVSSGEEALVYLKEHKADLLVLDMIMDPGMDGLDTYRSVLEIRPEQKAIILSGFSDSDRVKTAQALGAGAYLKKPYIIEKLGLAVRKELDRS